MKVSEGTAMIWVEHIVIPTYPAGKPDHNPLFLEKRVYQGSSGAVYPFAVVDTVSDERVDRTYEAVFLENDFLLIMVLPELGGRIQMAYAKHLDYHFVYYNRVIKPALVGLAGPWISGGIEFNWPQHHRPSSFSPVDFRPVTNADGSVTLWLGEIDRMNRTRGLAGLTLHPRRAYLEVEGRLFNRTALPQTFLWWANIAVAASDSYQSIFPPDVNAVYDHGRRDVSRFPIATGTYYKVDYSPGTDISRYRNIPVPTSYMAWHSEYDFLGGYDHGRRAGVLHVSDHHHSPGKKQWTWGCGDFGKSWDRNLTDADGPYVELMAGVFTDNQPDFSWLEPGEEKRFTQYFLPYSGIGVVKNASRDAAIALDLTAAGAVVGVCSSGARRYRIVLTRAGSPCLDESITVSPESPFTVSVALPPETMPEDLSLVLRSAEGEILLSYRPGPGYSRPVPEPARPALPPAQIQSQDELYLTGLHLEQYRHATFRPEEYYGEALRRDPGDARCNCAMGILLLRRGGFGESETYLQRATERLTERNANPRDGEAFLYLAYALELQERYPEAEGYFFKATWNAAQKASAYHGLARLSMRRAAHARALACARESLLANPRNHSVRTLKIVALRKMGRSDEAVAESEILLQDDPLNPAGLNERLILGCQTMGEESLRQRVLGEGAANSIELALEYSGFGCGEEASAVLQECVSPLAHYLLAFIAERAGRHDEAVAHVRRADELPTGTCFPNQIELIAALELAGTLLPRGARALYYLGNLLYDKRQASRAIAAWEQSAERDPRLPTVRRNLALAAFNKLGDSGRARKELECAFALDPSDPRLLFELDQLCKRVGVHPSERLDLLEANLPLVSRRDDLTLELVSLLTLQGEYERAHELLLGRRFHPWEGGEGKVTRQYVVSLLGMSKQAFLTGDARTAVEMARAALVFPESLGEGKLAGAIEGDVHYCIGRALEKLGSTDPARDAFQRAASGQIEPSLFLSYSDQPADMLFFQGLALARLGTIDEARARYGRLVDHAQRRRDAVISIDYFAVSLPDFLIFDDDLTRRNRIFCTYLEGIGRLGLALLERNREGGVERARDLLQAALAEDPSHGGAREILRDLENGWEF
jgi:tetratricopeptide (TPR) repeat protein